MPDLILRWSVGLQDTTKLSDFKNQDKFNNLIWLTKLSIVSFQKWFPNAHCILMYNGQDFDSFKQAFDSVDLPIKQLEIINQTKLFGFEKYINPYHFIPQGVWWKWVPFRFDKSCNEISIDTDIICINEPKDWYKWLEGKEEIVVAPERFDEIIVNTCGDFHKHPVLNGKMPINCGIVGQRQGCDFSERFFDITKEIRYGYTHDSLFITEQGAINIWVYSLEMENISHYVLNFEKCAWIRDFLYYLEKGVIVETVHATTWHKQIAQLLKPVLEKKVLNEMSNEEFLLEVLKISKEMNFYAKYAVGRQLGEDKKKLEFYF